RPRTEAEIGGRQMGLPHMTRRKLIQGAVGAAAAGAVAPATAAEPAPSLKGRVKHSLVKWCYDKHFPLEELCRVAVALGCKSVELGPPKDWPTLKKHGLTCAIAGSHGFEKGMNNPKYQPMCLAKLREAIDASADFGCPSVITFTG